MPTATSPWTTNDAAFYPSAFNLHPSKPPKSFHTFSDALRNSSTKLDDMLEELDLSKDETDALLASTKYASHRKLRTQLLSQQLTIAAQDDAQHALGTLLKLTDSNHAAIARLAATQLLAYANLQPSLPLYTPNNARRLGRRGQSLAQHPLTAPTSQPSPFYHL